MEIIDAEIVEFYLISGRIFAKIKFPKTIAPEINMKIKLKNDIYIIKGILTSLKSNDAKNLVYENNIKHIFDCLLEIL